MYSECDLKCQPLRSMDNFQCECFRSGDCQTCRARSVVKLLVIVDSVPLPKATGEDVHHQLASKFIR